MPRYLKIAAITAGGILLAVLLLFAIVAARVDPNVYKSDIIALVQHKHQRTLAIPGNITLTFYPRIGANLGQVTLSEPSSQEEFAAIDRARVSVALLPLLLRRELVVDRLDIEGMRARVVRNFDGSMNTGDLTAGQPAPAGAPVSAASAVTVRMAIDSIRINNARLQFEDRKTGRAFDISHLNIDSGAIAHGVPSHMALSANLRISKPAIATAITVSSKFLPDPDRRRIAFTDFDANLDVAPGDTKIKLKGQVDVDLDRDEFAAELKGRLDDSVFDVKAGLQAAAYHLTLHIDKLDLGRYQRRLVPDAAPDDPSPVVPGDAFDLSPLAMLHASGGIHVNELKVGTMHASNVRAALRSDAGKFVLQPIGADLYGGSGNGALVLDFTRSASTPHITFVQSLKDIDAGALLRDLLGRAPIDGKGEVQLDVNTEGASTAQMRQALAGAASLTLADGAINGIDLGAMVLGAKAAQGLAASGLRTKFSQFGASFTIANGVAHNADLALRTPLLQVAGAGDLDLAGEQVDYTLACTVASTGIALPVSLKGPWDAIAWRVDNKSISGAAVRQKARDKLKSAIRGLLKKR
ncbi:MAG: AsmA family protein [Pseudomonadota bacterium]